MIILNKFIIHYISFLFLIFSIQLKAQEIPNEFLLFNKKRFNTDINIDWDKHTTFGPYRFDDIFTISNDDSLIIRSRNGIQIINNNISVFGYGHFLFKNKFYGYLYPRVVNDISAFPRYSGVPRDISRGGFNSGETDLSGIGFQNDWLLIQIGRGRQSWGSGHEIQLALSEHSSAYDYGLLGLNFGKLRVRYIHGYLESDSSAINRYITARGIEWSNQNSFVISLSESVIYSGLNRPIDLGYINPMSTHLEIELNDRKNRLGTNSGNGVWQLSIDWMLRSNIRFSGNLLFDELVLDNIEKDEGKEHGMAYSYRVSYSPIIHDNYLINFYISLLKIGTPTFRHGDGNNNFVQRGKPLGWEYGSDGRELRFGLSYFNMNNLIGNIKIGQRQIGEESIIYNPYNTYFDHLSGKFPSGKVNNISFIDFESQWWLRPNISVMFSIRYTNSVIDDQSIEYKIGTEIFYPKIFKI